MNILLEIIAYFLFSIKIVLNLILFIFIKIILVILFFLKCVNLEDLEEIKFKKFFKSKEETQRDKDNIRGNNRDEIRPRDMNLRYKIHHKLYNLFYSNHFLTKRDINKINNLFKEYENKKILSERMYYNILYASKFWGFIYCYFGFSRRKYYHIDENGGLSGNLLIKFVAHHYILSSKMLLDYLIKKNNVNDIYKFFIAIIHYSRYSFTDNLNEEGILFKETMKSIFNSKYIDFDKNYEQDNVLTLTDKIIKLYEENGHFYYEIIYFYLDLLFNALFGNKEILFSEKRRNYFMETLKVCFRYDTSQKSRIYLIEKLYETIPLYIENENNKEDYFYQLTEEKLFNSIKNNILLLKDNGENMDDILSLIPNHKNLKKIHYYKLENKLNIKGIKEKVKKI